jgi:rhodanese-related sulfurtransferase
MNKKDFLRLTDSSEEILLLDIREPEEILLEETIPGSKNMPMGRVFTSAVDGLLPKNVPIVVFCRSGKRAMIVERELGAMGFSVQSLEGGLQELRTPHN